MIMFAKESGGTGRFGPPQNKTYNRTYCCYENRDTALVCNKRMGLEISLLKNASQCPWVLRAPSMSGDSLTYTMRDTNRLHVCPLVVSIYMVWRKLESCLGVSAPDQRLLE